MDSQDCIDARTATCWHGWFAKFDTVEKCCHGIFHNPGTLAFYVRKFCAVNGGIQTTNREQWCKFVTRIH